MNLTYELPQVVPVDRSGKRFEGFVTVKGRSLAVAVDERGVWCSPSDLATIQETFPELSQVRHGPPSLASGLEQLRHLHGRKEAGQAPTAASLTFLRALLGEIETLGWQKVDDVTPDLSHIVFCCVDEDGHRHLLEVNAEPRPNSKRQLHSDLPGHMTTAWSSRQISLSALYELFAEAVTALTPFWREMAALDASVWVLEPERPNFADTTRRIALGDGASLRIELDPSEPRQPPRLQFLGPPAIIEPLRDRLDSNFAAWSSDSSVLDNLRQLLGVTFPSRESTAKEDVVQQCGICYSFNLEGDLPEVSCASAQCHQLFHATCMYDWLRMLPATRRVFNTLHGECPYCCSMVTVGVRLEK